MSERVHATSVAMRQGRSWRAVLLRGPSGSGKSDLALRLIDAGARLIADDQTELVRAGKAVIASAPARIAGLIEARGMCRQPRLEGASIVESSGAGSAALFARRSQGISRPVGCNPGGIC